ncbi:MAG: hypothetical protein HYU39_02225 [Thaumarchaeota archaeon]|nr:hypothetical protein [Nitrososphaerota archaeon]
MANRKSIASRKPAQDLPPKFRQLKAHPFPKDGKIQLSDILNGIYDTLAAGEAKRVAPQELQQLKTHFDGAMGQLQSIADKIKASRTRK